MNFFSIISVWIKVDSLFEHLYKVKLSNGCLVSVAIKSCQSSYITRNYGDFPLWYPITFNIKCDWGVVGDRMLPGAPCPLLWPGLAASSTPHFTSLDMLSQTCRILWSHQNPQRANSSGKMSRTSSVGIYAYYRTGYTKSSRGKCLMATKT